MNEGLLRYHSKSIVFSCFHQRQSMLRSTLITARRIDLSNENVANNVPYSNVCSKITSHNLKSSQYGPICLDNVNRVNILLQLTAAQ